ncbi:hypothetical protein D9M68_666180 [compost metagenome]
MCRGLICQCIRGNITIDQALQQVYYITAHTDRNGFFIFFGLQRAVDGLVYICIALVQVAGFDTLVHTPLLDLSCQTYTFIHGDSQGLSATHTA